jgi:hypothetical protein
MRNLLFLLFIAISFGCAAQKQAPVNTLTKKELKNGWQLLFDGTNPAQWRSANKDDFPTKGWSIREGCLVSGGGGSLVSREEYSNFDLVWEWKMIDAGGNSGVKYFVKDALGIEYQMLDDAAHPWMKEGKMKPNDYHTNGAVYELYPPSIYKKSKPVGEWNSSRVTSYGMHVVHWLNGEKVADYVRGSKDFAERVANSKFKDTPGFGVHEQGLILLQDHGSEVWFRNIRIRKL